jgi:hypothetical protein
MAMKISLAVLGLLLTTFAVAPRAQAQSNYLWCARYGTPYDDTSCGFTSFEQCMASVSGIGGFCERNDTYRPPLAAVPPRHQARKSHTKNS